MDANLTHDEILALRHAVEYLEGVALVTEALGSPTLRDLRSVIDTLTALHARLRPLVAAA